MTSYGSDDDATHVLDNYDVYVVPVMNPDGYDYTWTNVSFASFNLLLLEDLGYQLSGGFWFGL